MSSTEVTNSEAILGRPAPTADVRLKYGPSTYQFGDLRLPRDRAGRGGREAGLYPVVIGVHGGYYRARYGLDYFGHVCAALTAAGLATWNIEYRRLGNHGGGWPGTFEDVAAAADYLRALERRYRLDLGRVMALGHSAGGHLACWLAARHRIPAGLPLHCSSALPISSVVSLAGVLDLRRAWELRLSRGVVDRLLGGSPEQVRVRYEVASPVELLPLGVPQTIIHGTADTSVPYEISRDYAEAARQRGDVAELVTLEGAGHFEIVDPGTPEWQCVLRSVQKAMGG
ncbi:MAG: alpha/beta hydrolase family protein [Ktedonobacterales bacterium]